MSSLFDKFKRDNLIPIVSNFYYNTSQKNKSTSYHCSTDKFFRAFCQIVRKFLQYHIVNVPTHIFITVESKLTYFTRIYGQ